CCKDGWFSYRGHCYFIDLGIKLSFPAARIYCLNLGADLVQLETIAENNFLKGYLKKIEAKHAWIGLNDMTHEGIWRWYGTNEHATFSDWTPGQPDNAMNIEDCVHFNHYHYFKWNDFPCRNLVAPFCETDQI
ncbi:perlucin-like, partial [Ruditapes philippinarum]|uniref:perlucin-like n=1 Tax=Ruditapes philippinarum TaxID=129788 RepID=UPI00295A6138